jgi:hypothetical protein
MMPVAQMNASVCSRQRVNRSRIPSFSVELPQ